MEEKPSAGFSAKRECYQLRGQIGEGSSAKVWSAVNLENDEEVAIKMIDLEASFKNLEEIRKEIQMMAQCSHPNVVKYQCSFVHENTLWIVMQLLRSGSCLDIMKAKYHDGIPETTIAFLLREVLQGLEYLHKFRHIHRDIKAGNILVDVEKGVQLADFGVSALLLERGKQKATTFVGTPCWMAPEVMEQERGYDEKADIWSFGITALELAKGRAPFSKYPPMKVLLLTLKNEPPQLTGKYTKEFRDMAFHCLQKDPDSRPTATKLLEHRFFKNLPEHISQTEFADVLRSLSPLEERFLETCAAPSAIDELGVGPGHTPSVSGWDFHVEDLEKMATKRGNSRFQITKQPKPGGGGGGGQDGVAATAAQPQAAPGVEATATTTPAAATVVTTATETEPAQTSTPATSVPVSDKPSRFKVEVKKDRSHVPISANTTPPPQQQQPLQPTSIDVSQLLQDGVEASELEKMTREELISVILKLTNRRQNVPS